MILPKLCDEFKAIEVKYPLKMFGGRVGLDKKIWSWTENNKYAKVALISFKEIPLKEE